jgi:hypothetical protein
MNPIPRPASAFIRKPSRGDHMIWCAAPGRADGPLIRVVICENKKLDRWSYRVQKVEEGSFHTAREKSLIWPESLAAWSDIVLKQCSVGT